MTNKYEKSKVTPDPDIVKPMDPDERRVLEGSDKRAVRMEQQEKWPITERRAQVFLAHLRRHGVVSKASYAASPQSKSASPPTTAFYKFRKMNPDFAAAWDDAIEHARGETEMEIHRRGIQGVDEPVFYKGEEVAKVKKFSDALLLAKAKATIPEYRDRTTVTHAGSVNNVDLGLEGLSAESRADLRRILEREAAKAEESEIND